MTAIANTPSPELLSLVKTMGGEWNGNTAMCRCPVHADGEPSLSIRQGDRGILVKCFAGCHSTDILKAISNIRRNGNYAPTHVASNKPTVDFNALALRVWEEAVPVSGTLGEKYLRIRNLWPIRADVRFHPRCAHGAKPKTVYKPALILPIREGRNIIAIQRIFLDPATGYYTEKSCLGYPGGGAWKGTGIGSTLALAEGFEDATAYYKIKNTPCWATFGTERVNQILIPDCVTTLIIATDPDIAGRRAANLAMTHYAKSGRTIITDFPPAGYEDWAKVRA